MVAAVPGKYFSSLRLEVVSSHQFVLRDFPGNTTGCSYFDQGVEHRFGGDQVGKDSDMSNRLPYLWLNTINLNKIKI